MTSGFLRNSLFGSLAFRVILFLSLALLPIGIIAFVQNQQIAEQSQRTAELSLIAVTEQAAATERSLLQEALGASRALTSVVKLVRNNPARCSDFLKSYKDEVSKYLVVGFVDTSGMMQCSSTYQAYDLRDSPIVKNPKTLTQRTVTGSASGRVSHAEAVIVTVPVFEEDETIGFFFISMARETLEAVELEDPIRAPLSLVTFNTDGLIISSELDRDRAQTELPASYPLEQLTGPTRQVFTSRNADGLERVYAVIPLVEGAVFAMSVWPKDTALLETDFSSRLSSFLPIVMWIASLVVAFWALNRLAIAHIRKLGRQMRHFALNRTLPRKPFNDGVPNEIVAMEQSFLGMAQSILQDEARLEDSLREKNMLLKEVHHRVKNNLQLISSIMNMQIRQAPTEANKRVLQRLQDRILSLATVHQSLYQDNEMTRVDAGMLLREIVARSLDIGMERNSGIKVTEDYDSILIGADDAAPLSLLTSEAVTNALKYVASGRGSKAKIHISLKHVGEERAVLRIMNTAGGNAHEEGTGLGSRLIQAFSRQLNGALEIVDEGGDYILTLDFPVPQMDKATYDY
ncbi:sensor histidine kinase [Sulfitobacter guttiformis]|uniref:histidine kinase n=1 Tax=Sulfitobacter guttiformis TaxID=74349 RepID=A0A420DRA8_9RHOB|nr:sensor histidine kinase [Sulfitobacter guttiformis]KIN74158.1 Periplasmic sensor signal transduction histidine kinase [Sulfitobacter guttiformis KCTC 32187]RKE96772.1 two-component sensor histidine kinase [Sulfitobacter guttiformis]